MLVLDTAVNSHTAEWKTKPNSTLEKVPKIKSQHTTDPNSSLSWPSSRRSRSTRLCSRCISAISWSRLCLSHSSWRWCSSSRRAAYSTTNFDVKCSTRFCLRLGQPKYKLMKLHNVIIHYATLASLCSMALRRCSSRSISSCRCFSSCFSSSCCFFISISWLHLETHDYFK